MGWTDDIHDMHRHYGFHEKTEGLTPAKLEKLLKFRLDFLREELRETENAYVCGDSDEIVDGLIDLCVVAIGTLDLLQVDSELAWKRVHQANMSKRVGIKEGRPNPLGLPDLVKPEGWAAPTHEDNVGRLKEIFK